MKTTLEKLLGANTKLRSLAIAFILAAIVFNFPWLLDWLPASTKGDILTAADYVLRYGAGLAIWWAKQANVSGTGAADNPQTKATPDGETRVVR
jgi:hypothetical protein